MTHPDSSPAWYLAARHRARSGLRAERVSRYVLSIAIAGVVAGDQVAEAQSQVIAGVATQPLSSTSTAQADIDAGMQALESLNPTAHSGIVAGVASGTVTIVQLPPESPASPKGAADSDTIAVYLGDDPDPGTIARRLEHEYFHWSEGEDGRLNPCEHMEIWTISYESAQFQSCINPELPSVPCSVFDELLAKITEYVVLCDESSSGSGLPFPSLQPPCVCRQ